MRLRENNFTLCWTVEIDEERERERERIEERKQFEINEKKNLAEGDEEPGEREKRGEVKINNCRGY